MYFRSFSHSQGQKFVYCTTCDLLKTLRANAMFSSVAAKYLSQVNPVLSFFDVDVGRALRQIDSPHAAVEFLRECRQQFLKTLAHRRVPLLATQPWPSGRFSPGLSACGTRPPP